VSTFDIAFLVQTAMKERQRKRMPQGSIIDKLIEEALLEFTSLTDDKDGDGAKKTETESVAAAMPLNPAQFVDPTNWAKELGESSGRSDPMRLSLPAEVFEHGNLSALEDDLPSSSSPSQPPPISHGTAPSSGAGGPTSGPRSGSVHPEASPASADPRSGRSSVPSSSSLSTSGLGKMRGSSGELPVTPLPGGKSKSTAGVVVVMLVAAAAVAVAWFGGFIHH
jgi:hypothetical protein